MNISAAKLQMFSMFLCFQSIDPVTLSTFTCAVKTESRAETNRPIREQHQHLSFIQTLLLKMLLVQSSSAAHMNPVMKDLFHWMFLQSSFQPVEVMNESADWEWITWCLRCVMWHVQYCHTCLDCPWYHNCSNTDDYIWRIITDGSKVWMELSVCADLSPSGGQNTNCMMSL